MPRSPPTRSPTLPRSPSISPRLRCSPDPPHLASRDWEQHRYDAAVGYKHSLEGILEAAADVALESGIAKLTYASVAARAGVSDRMIVYYLPTKADLVRGAAGTIGADFQRLLAEAFGQGRRPVDELVAAAWPVFTSAEGDRVFRVFFEIVGLAASGREPFDELAPAMVGAWADWLADRTKGSTAEIRQRRALSVIASLDGLLLLRHTIGPAAAAQAAHAFGITVPLT